MADDRVRMIRAYDNTPDARTRGMLPCSSKVLTQIQKCKLTDLKAQIIRDNYTYLSQHPEVGALVELLLRSVLRSRPKLIRKFIANFFRDPELRDKVNEYTDVRKTRENEREKESWNFTKRTDDLTKWRSVLRNNRANEKEIRHLEKKQMEEKRKLESPKFIEYIKTQYFGSVCELFLERPQYTASEDNLLRKRVAEFLKKYFKNDEEVSRLMDHFDVVFREKETEHIVKCVLNEMFEKLVASDVVSTQPGFLYKYGGSTESYMKVLYRVSDSWEVESN